MKVKHSKYKNTGILFELLSRQLTSDTVEGVKPHSLDIIGKFFRKGTQLHEELQYYNVLNVTKYKDVKKASILLETVLGRRSNLDLNKLNSEKYKLIKEIKKYYDLDNFFKAKINNYTKQASIYTLFELSSNPKSKLTSLVEQKSKIVSNYLLSTPLDKSKPSNIFEQFKTYDKDLRLLSYKTAVDSFNTKYSSLNLEQKQLLSVYINEVSNTPKLKNYINECVIDLKSKLNKYKTIVKDPAISIKLDEMVNILKPIKKSPKDEDVNNLLKYYSLVTELKNIHG